MGNMQAAGYAEGVDLGLFNLQVALAAHLASNHWPPVDQAFVPIAVQAIEAVNAGEGETPIEMPNDLTRSAHQIVEGLHLHAFLEDDDG